MAQGLTAEEVGQRWLELVWSRLNFLVKELHQYLDENWAYVFRQNQQYDRIVLIGSNIWVIVKFLTESWTMKEVCKLDQNDFPHFLQKSKTDCQPSHFKTWKLPFAEGKNQEVKNWFDLWGVMEMKDFLFKKTLDFCFELFA